MPIRISGSTGVSGLDGTAAAPSTQGANTSAGLFFPTINTVAIATNGTEAMRIDSSGNMGIGTNTPGTALTLGNNKVFSWLNSSGSYNGLTSGTQILKYSDNNLYVDNLDASTNIIFRRNGPTESMRIDSSGYLGIGTSSPLYKLQVANGNMAITSSTGAGTFQITDDSDQSRGLLLKSNHSGTANTYIGTNSSVKNVIFGIDSIERMRLDTGGSFMVGSGTIDLASSGFAVAMASAGVLNGVSIIKNSTNWGTALFIRRNSAAGTGTGIEFSNNGATVGSIGIASASVTYNTTSDISLKTNIIDSFSSLSSIISLPIRQYDWISTGEHVDYGFVAQEVKQYAPEIVSIDENNIWSVDYSRITPRLIKAIQELKAEFDAYKASHP